MKGFKRWLCTMFFVLLAAAALAGGYLVDRQNKAALDGRTPNYTLWLSEDGRSLRYGAQTVPLPDKLVSGVQTAVKWLYPMLPARSRVLGQAVQFLEQKLQ